MNRVKTLLLMATILLLSTTLIAGIYDRSGEIKPAEGVYQSNPTRDIVTRDTDVTMSWLDGLTPNTNFGGWTKDYFMEYYVPAADGFVTSIDFHFSDLPAVAGGGLSVWIYAAAYPWPEIDTESIADAQNDANLGYYDEATGFETVGTNWIQMGINDIDGADPDFNYDPLGAQGWPFLGSGSMSVEPNADDEGWVNFNLMDAMGENYYFLQGEAFIVVVRLNGFPDEGDGTDYRMGFYSAILHYDPQPSLKFYSTISSPNGRTSVDDWGWYIRSYVWDWDINATLTGDRGPAIEDVTSLGVTLDQTDRTVVASVTDDNPGGGPEGVASVDLMVAVDGADYVAFEMTVNDTGYYTADIAGIAGGHIDYYITATDVEGLTSEMPFPFGYDVFVPASETLVVFNGGDISGYPAEYYFGIGDYDTYATYDFSHDVWGGEIIASLAHAYTTIYEITTDGPVYDNSAVIRAWLDEGAKNYFLCGDEWFGALTGWVDQAYVAGDFEYDILGISYIYNDITADDQGADPIEAVEGHHLMGDLYTAHTAAGDTLMYDPVYEIGVTNWLDGVELVNAGDANMTTFGRSPDVVISLDRIVGDDHIIWMGMDPLSINASPYTWWGFSELSLQTKSLEWFPGVVGIDERTAVPSSFNLSAAYPNPFNPVTNIAYELGHGSDVTITVYNMLGQQVATLMSGYQTAGNYTVQWNGLNSAGQAVASGLYFYEMQTDGFSSTQKMMLIK